ncbi:DNA primase [Xenorhabdus sp. KK7.4]|nr:DNA primase [Xenorhabdus sp. KK7.4]
MFDDWMKENEQKRFEQEQKRLEQEQKQLEQKLKQLEQEQAASQQTQAAPEPKQAKFERVHPEPLIPDESIQLFDAEAQAMFDDWMKENEQKRFEQEQKRLEQEQKQLEQKLKQLEQEQAASQQTQAALEPQQNEENSIEPYIENEKAQVTTEEAKAWLTSQRTPLTEMIAEDDLQLREQEQAASQQTQAALEPQQNEENSIGPYIENEKAQVTTEEAKAWLTSQRTPLTEMIVEANLREQNNKTLSTQIKEQDSEIIKPKIQQSEHDYFNDNSKFQSVIPDKVSKSYIEVEGKFYFQNKPDSLAFVDKGAKLQTKLNSHQVADSMVEIAEARGWSEIQVKGTEDFRREVWLQATAKGLTAHGYKPKEEDLARLKKLSSERGINEIESRELADDVKKFQANKKNSSEIDSTKQTQINNDNQKSRSTMNVSDSSSLEKVNKLAGKLIEHGEAPYEHKEGNQSSYFVTLENSDGKQSKTWGVDLKRAITESEAQKGDNIELENLGRKPVTVKKDIQDKDGNVIKTEEINTFRNKWEIKAEAIRDKDRPAKEVIKEHPDLINEITAVKLAEKVSQNMNTNDQERFMNRVRDKLADKVANGEKSPEIKVKETQSINQTKAKEIEEIER